MDPLYANLDKRNNSADQPQTPPAPQPTAYSMPNFGQPTSSSTAPTGPIVSNPSVPTPNATAPTTPIVSTPTRPTTSGTGDIILNIDQPKKKRKGLVVGIVIVCLLIACGVGAFLIFNKKSSENLYTEYINLLVNGDKTLKVDDVVNINISDTFAVKKFQEEDKAYFEKLNDVFDESYAEQSSLSNQADDAFMNIGDALNLSMQLLIYGTLDEELLLAQYMSGQDIVKSEESSLANLEKEGDSASEYASYRIEFVKLYEEYLGIIENSGCLDKDSISYDCLHEKAPTDEFLAISELLESSKKQIKYIEENTIKIAVRLSLKKMEVILEDGDDEQ